MDDVLTNFHISEENLKYLEGIAPGAFLAFLAFAAMAMAVYILGVLVLVKSLERRFWYRPNTCGGTALSLLCLYTSVVSSTGFVPMLKFSLRTIPCDENMMKYVPIVLCHSVHHWSMIVTAICLGMLASIVTWRMAFVGFNARALNNIFDASKDGQVKQRVPSHPLALNDYRYDSAMVVVKIVLCFGGTLSDWMPDCPLPRITALVNMTCASALLIVGATYEKYYGGQVQKGRLFEPNSIGTMLDMAVFYYFTLTFISSVCGNQIDNILNVLALLTPLVSTLGYFFRSKLNLWMITKRGRFIISALIRAWRTKRMDSIEAAGTRRALHAEAEPLLAHYH